MADLSLNISDITAARHSNDPGSDFYVVDCDVLEILGKTYVHGDLVELPVHVATTAIDLNQIKEEQ